LFHSIDPLQQYQPSPLFLAHKYHGEYFRISCK
jgi:hypothetical protein